MLLAWMMMGLSLDPFRQVLKKVCMFKPWQSRALLLGHCCPKVLFLGNAPLKVPYHLAHTSNGGVVEHSRIQMP